MMMNDQEEFKMNEIRNETTETQIQKLMKEVELYKQAIQDARDALASAEMELDETLEAEYKKARIEGPVQ